MLIPFTLRAAKGEEHDWIYRIKTEAYKGYVERIWGWDEDWQVRNFNEELGKYITQVVSINGVDIGFLQIDDLHDQIHVLNIILSPAHRGLGIGTAILQHLMNLASNSNRLVTLAVFKINGRARLLYESVGFSLVGETDTHFRFSWTSQPASRPLA